MHVLNKIKSSYNKAVLNLEASEYYKLCKQGLNI